MAKTWIVTPNDGVTAATDGVYVFPANDSYDDKVYTVTLKDTDCNCVAHKTVTVKGKTRPGCSCSITSDYGTTSSKISGGQHTNVKVGTFSSYFCTGTTSFSYASGDADFLSNFTYVGDDIYAKVGKNESTTDSRMAIYNASCGGSLTIYQDKGGETCPTQSSIINTNTAVANTGGTQVAVMQILKDSTYTAYTITATSTSSSYVSNITQGAHLHDNWYVVLADVTANPGTTCRSLYFDVIAEGPTLGSGCTYNNVTVTLCPTDYLIGLAAGTVSANGGRYDLARFKNNLTDCTTALTVSMSDGSSATIADSGTSYAYDSSYNVIKVNVPQNTSTNSRTISVTCTLTHTGGARCTDTKTFTQEGATQTCGCNSITYNGTQEADPQLDGLYYYAKIVNTTNSPIDIDDISFDFTADGSSSTEEFHNRQTIGANTTDYYNHGGSICLDSCGNNYTSATISNGRITIWEGSSTGGKSVTLNKSSIVCGDTIIFTYNG